MQAANNANSKCFFLFGGGAGGSFSKTLLKYVVKLLSCFIELPQRSCPSKDVAAYCGGLRQTAAVIKHFEETLDFAAGPG